MRMLRLLFARSYLQVNWPIKIENSILVAKGEASL